MYELDGAPLCDKRWCRVAESWTGQLVPSPFILEGDELFIGQATIHRNI